MLAQGRWAITMGLNNLFDVFDCQVHQFKQQSNGDLYGDIDWRIQLSDGDFTERHAVQTFKQVGHRNYFLPTQRSLFNHARRHVQPYVAAMTSLLASSPAQDISKLFYIA
jgi:hypothetical protein